MEPAGARVRLRVRLRVRARACACVRLRALEDAALQRGVAVVTGTDNAAHMKSDLDLFGFALAPAEVERISALKPPPA